jgi:phenylalanine-4-hydroxylase
VTAPGPARVAFDLRRMMRTKYKIDTYQSIYFVIDSFGQLFDATAPDFAPLYRDVRASIARDGELAAGVVLAGEREFAPATA